MQIRSNLIFQVQELQQRFAEVEEAVRLEEEIIVIRVILIRIISIIRITIRLKEERGDEGEKEQLKVSKFIMI